MNMMETKPQPTKSEFLQSNKNQYPESFGNPTGSFVSEYSR